MMTVGPTTMKRDATYLKYTVCKA